MRLRSECEDLGKKPFSNNIGKKDNNGIFWTCGVWNECFLEMSNGPVDNS